MSSDCEISGDESVRGVGLLSWGVGFSWGFGFIIMALGDI